MAESLAKLSCRVVWEIENILNELMGLAKEISGQKCKCCWLFLLATSLEGKKEYCFQAVIGGNVKGPGQFFQPAKSSQSKKGP